ncbi:MAG: mitochondrial fission ELM1 family protein [Rickettsiales bacterium]|nr:mitochondrial fission ELM1 family protein [Rickettsiales bacterium]
MKVWVLKDFKIGSSKQAEMLANSLSNDVVIKNIEYTKYIAIPNIIKPFSVGIDFNESDDVLEDTDYPSIIVFSGRRLAGLAIYLKKYIFKKVGKIVKIISILNPDYSFKYFDFVVLPSHDDIEYDKYNNIITFNGALCIDNLSEKTTDKEFWLDQLKGYKQNFYMLAIGGATKDKKFDTEDFKKVLKLISTFVKRNEGTLLISTSRRTPEDCVAILNKDNLDCDFYLYKWGKSSTLNPYYSFIDLSKIVFLTADSISMIAEVSSLGRPVYVYKNDKMLGKKHIKFCDLMVKKNIIREIKVDNDVENIEAFNYTKPNELEYVRNEILKRL